MTDKYESGLQQLRAFIGEQQTKLEALKMSKFTPGPWYDSSHRELLKLSENTEEVMNNFDRTHIEEIFAGSGDWFTAQLLRLIAKADRINRNRLRIAFPEEVSEFEKAEARAWAGVEMRTISGKVLPDDDPSLAATESKA